MSMTTTLAELASLTGSDLGSSHWIEVTEERLDTFDPERTERESPSPVPVGSKIRLTDSLKEVEQVTGGLPGGEGSCSEPASCVRRADSLRR